MGVQVSNSLSAFVALNLMSKAVVVLADLQPS